MCARLPTPLKATHTPGPVRLPNGRDGYTTRTGVVIGLRAQPLRREVGQRAEIIQSVLLAPRPLRWDQMLVRALLRLKENE